MPRNEAHSLQITPSAEQSARQRFVLSLKQDIDRRLRPQLKNVLAEDVAESDKDKEIAAALEASDARAVWGRLARSAQELMWEAVQEPLVDQEATLTEKCKELLSQRPAGGSLHLDDTFSPPRAMANIPVHLQPGGYCLERHADDVLAGALYEAGGALYSQGQSIGLGESKAELVIRFLAEKLPDFQPLKILDLGCSAGGSTTPYSRLYTNAEIYGVDVAPGLLRYASARAEAMGLKVHFHQCDAGNTPFADSSFDLVVSHNAMHEMAPSTIKSMMCESHRLLKAGGIAVHQDVPLRNSELSAFARVDYAWDRLHNNEPFWSSFADMDLPKTMAAAGFGEAVRNDRVAQLGGGMAWDLIWAEKPGETQ